MNQKLRDILNRAETWPSAAQDDLAEFAREIELAQSAGHYTASAEELSAIDAADRSGSATAEEVRATLQKFQYSARQPPT